MRQEEAQLVKNKSVANEDIQPNKEGTALPTIGDILSEQDDLMDVQVTAVEDSGTEDSLDTRKPGLAEELNSEKDKAQILGGRPTLEKTAGESEIVRVRKQKWTPEAGFRRCGNQCPGCAQKCAEQGIEDCQNCFLKKHKKKTNNPCANRGECSDPKPAMMLKTKSSRKKNSQLSVSVKEDNLEKSPTTKSLVGNQVVEYVPDQVEGLVKMIEKNSGEVEEDEFQHGGKDQWK